MKFTVLGSGGNTPTPLPTCDCRVCLEARREGVPYARRGNAIYLHDERALIDAPELVWETLNRQQIGEVEYVFLSHFHADHTLGLRALQAFGLEDPPVESFVGEVPTLVMSERTRELAVEANEVLAHLTETWADTRVLADGERLTLGDLSVTHLAAPIEPDGPDDVSAFLFEDGESVALVSPDENRHLPLDRLPPLDLWIKECGYFRETPAGELLVTERAEETSLAHELSFAESLEQIRAVEPDRVVLTELEELYRRSYDDYERLAARHEELALSFAHDGLELAV
ncbi:hypothetical protein BRC62_01360 [Halobacteriales archaeon QH_10_67_13]|nr:MAG: hypothetical protein BRC62_01360 [Halobacteriales archaeon QH_10_67_13]